MDERMRILVVEDDEKIASFVVKGLRQSGYAVDHSADGERNKEELARGRHAATTQANWNWGRGTA